MAALIAPLTIGMIYPPKQANDPAGNRADSFIAETPTILETMKDIVVVGIKPLDALHIACAQALDCQYFLTVDKGILKKAAAVTGIQILSPIDFVIEQGL